MVMAHGTEVKASATAIASGSLSPSRSIDGVKRFWSWVTIAVSRSAGGSSIPRLARTASFTKSIRSRTGKATPSFPSFVYNVLDYLGSRSDVLAAGSVRPGQPVALDSALAVEKVRVRKPEKQKEAA